MSLIWGPDNAPEILLDSFEGRATPLTVGAVSAGITRPSRLTKFSELGSAISANATILLKSSTEAFLFVIQSSILVILIGLLIRG